MNCKSIVLFVFISHCFFPGSGQILDKSMADSLMMHDIEMLDLDYNKKLEDQLAFVNGTLYTLKGNAYSHPYLDYNWSKGLIYFQSEIYEYHYMKYDIEEGGLIILKEEVNQAYPIKLQHYGIDAFVIDTKKFVLINNLNKQYYVELAYEGGDYQVFLEWKKKGYYGSSTTVEYRLSQRVVVHFKNEYYEINSPLNIYKLLGDEKKRLKKFKKDQNINFYDDKLNATIEFFKYYYLLASHQ